MTHSFPKRLPSDLAADPQVDHFDEHRERHRRVDVALRDVLAEAVGDQHKADHDQEAQREYLHRGVALDELADGPGEREHERSEEHTSELQSLMRISYAVYCLKKKIHTNH